MDRRIERSKLACFSPIIEETESTCSSVSSQNEERPLLKCWQEQNEINDNKEFKKVFWIAAFGLFTLVLLNFF